MSTIDLPRAPEREEGPPPPEPNGRRKVEPRRGGWGRMTPLDTLRFALRALRDNRMRSSLTMLGVIIGVAAVVSAVAVGQGGAASITNSVGQLGNNLLYIVPANPRLGPGRPEGLTTTLRPADADAIRDRCVNTVSRVSSGVRGSALLKAGSQNWRTTLAGGDPYVYLVNNYVVEMGRSTNQVDEETRARVCVLGKTVVENLYGDKNYNPVGQEILVNRVRFKVVGVLAEKGTSTFGQNQDDTIMVPLNTALYRVLNQKHVSYLSVECSSQDTIELAQEQVISLLRQRHRLSPPFPENDDFTVMSQQELLKVLTTITGVLTALLAGIAAISLTVGGIGIMNIMLVSVTERTREIGIRKALGATEGNIRSQFLIEAALLSIAGGIVGVLIGGGISAIAAKISGWPIAPSAEAVLIAVGVSAGIGIFFGYWPARKAARLHPIEALRRE
ncbi:MAG TPA: ABC transporter permease [Armatimonadota bacterium]|nr:ABC transporter permease [Armatimonadota bacterium]